MELDHVRARTGLFDGLTSRPDPNTENFIKFPYSTPQVLPAGAVESTASIHSAVDAMAALRARLHLGCSGYGGCDKHEQVYHPLLSTEISRFKHTAASPLVNKHMFITRIFLFFSLSYHNMLVTREAPCLLDMLINKKSPRKILYRNVRAESYYYSPNNQAFYI